jgi:peptidoglycan hydrolase CwlO-like protein
MGYGCCGVGTDSMRNFLTRDEKISMLKEYKGNLEKEIQGIAEKIKDLESKK